MNIYQRNVNSFVLSLNVAQMIYQQKDIHVSFAELWERASIAIWKILISSNNQGCYSYISSDNLSTKSSGV